MPGAQLVQEWLCELLLALPYEGTLGDRRAGPVTEEAGAGRLWDL